MSLWQIKSLPVPLLLAPGALVGIWVTNKQKYLRFTKTELFPHWSVELVAEWYWVKVTRKGELVTDLDSPHKKPYEPLLLGRYKAKMDCLETSCLIVTKENKSGMEKIELTCNENELKVLSPQQKRKKISGCDDGDDDNDDGDEIRKICCVCDKDIATSTSQEWSSLSTTSLNCLECSDPKSEQLNNFSHTVPAQSQRKCCLSGHKLLYTNKVDLSDNMKSLSDVAKQKEKTMEEVMELNERKWFYETPSDSNLANNCQDNKCVMTNTNKHSVPLRREVTAENCDLLPYHQIICSVPCKIHSRKPPLNGK